MSQLSLASFSFDILAAQLGWRRGTGDWAGVNASIAAYCVRSQPDRPVQVIQEAGSTLWQTQLPLEHCWQLGFPEYTATQRPSFIQPAARIWISPIQRRFSALSDFPKAQWHPRVLWVGIGCKRNTSGNTIAAAVQAACQTYHLSNLSIAGVATIDRKLHEPGLVEFCKKHDLPIQSFSAELLRSIAVPHPSPRASTEVNTPSVAEAAALLAASQYTIAASPEFCEVQAALRPKQIFHFQGEPGAVTVSIAQSQQEYFRDKLG